MKTLEHLKLKAREMYLSGMSLSDICDRLNKGKSTVFYWIREVERPITFPRNSNPIESPARIRARLAASKKNHEKAEDRRAAYREEALAYLPRLETDMVFRDFIMLYLTEGTRKSKRETIVAVANSNPSLLRLATHFIRELTGKEPSFWVQYHEDQDVESLRSFWATELKAVPESIDFIKKSNSGQLSGRNWASHYGVMTVRTGSVRLRAMLGVWMEAIQTW